MRTWVRAVSALAVIVSLSAPAHAGLFGKKRKQDGTEAASAPSSTPAVKKARRYNRVEWGNEWRRVFRPQDYWRPHYLEMF